MQPLTNTLTEHKIPLAKSIHRLSSLSETPDDQLMRELLDLRLRRGTRRAKFGKKPKKERPEILFKSKGCLAIEELNVT
jgi:hypothetical protein